MGELHLEIIVDRLKREFNVEASVGKPQVAYKETLTRAGRGRGPLHQADRRPRPVRPRQDPADPARSRARAIEFENEIVGGTIPREFIKPIEEGIKEALTRGVLAGYPIDDVERRALRRLVPRRRLERNGVQDRRLDGVQGRRQEGQAGAAGAGHAASRWWCPRSTWATSSATSTAGAATSSRWSARRHQIINARVPLSEMFGYATEMRSRTQGRATYSMHFDRYEQAPNHISDEVVKGK